MRAYEELYTEFEHQLLTTALRMLNNRHDAEDAVQQTFLRLYRGIGKFKYQSKIGTYLYRILFNVCFDLMEKRKRHAVTTPHIEHGSYTIQPDLKLHLENAIAALPEKMRACFVLFAIQDMKQDDICSVLNMKIGTVKAHIFAAKERLRSSFFEPLPGDVK